MQGSIWARRVFARSGRTVCALALMVVAGCGDDSSAPLGNGSVLQVDVDASSVGAQGDNGDDGDDGGSDDSPFASLDGPYGPVADGSSPRAICSGCACAPGTFCFGGSSSSSPSGVVCDQTASTTIDVGCHTLPSGCGSPPDCACLLAALGLPSTSCYPVCEPLASPDGAAEAPLVYCPE